MKVKIICDVCNARSPEIEGSLDMDEKNLNAARKRIEEMGWQAKNIPKKILSLCPDCLDLYVCPCCGREDTEDNL